MDEKLLTIDDLLEQINMFEELPEDDPRGTPLNKRLLHTEYKERE